MKFSIALLAILTGLMANPAMAEKAQKRDCSATVNSAIDSGVKALRLGFTLGAPPGLDDAITAGVAAFKNSLGC